MNRTEHLLVCLAEELSEISADASSAAKIVSKALRFGLDECPTQDFEGEKCTEGTDNATRIGLMILRLEQEIIDLLGVHKMLVDAGALPELEHVVQPSPRQEAGVRKKIEKVERFMSYSRRCGVLELES